MAVVNIPAPSKKDNEALSKLGPGNYQLVYDKETKKWRVVKRGDLKPNQVSYNDWSSGTKTYEEKGPGQGGAGPKYVGKTELLQTLLKEWHFFKTFISNVEMTLAKTDLEIAERYVKSLVDPSLHRIFDQIKSEFELTVKELLLMTGESEILGNQPILARTLQVRDTYLAPIQLLQVSLLAKVRNQKQVDPVLTRALLLTKGVLA